MALTQTVANVCERLDNIKRTHLYPQRETGTFATHSGKYIYFVAFKRSKTDIYERQQIYRILENSSTLIYSRILSKTVYWVWLWQRM